MDGTLTVPNLDFKAMYSRAGVASSSDILVEIAAMSEPRKSSAQGVVDEMEEEGRRTLQLMPGAADVARWLQLHGVPTAMVTRNSAETVAHLHAALWEPAGLVAFAPAISRDDDLPPKPDPAALGRIAEAWGVPLGEELLMVGDSPSNDVVFGKRAGVGTALLDTGRAHLEGGGESGADIVVDSLLALAPLLWARYEIGGELGSNMPLGKYEPPEPGSAACAAARDGDLAQLRDADGRDLPDASGNTPLIWAANAGRVEVIEFLLSDGSDPNTRGFLGATALCRACRNGDVAALEVLLKAPGVLLDCANLKMQSPLHFAAFKRHRGAVQLMLRHGASTTTLDRKGRTPAEDTSDPLIRADILAARV